MYHVVFNPAAGKNKSAEALCAVEKSFQENGKEYTVYRPTSKEELRQIVGDLTSTGEETELVVLGGDGTIHDTLGAIKDFSHLNLGIIPAGTGNDFAAAVGIPEDPAEAIQIVLREEAKETDYLEVGGVRCMNVGGLGIDVDVLVRYAKCKKHNKLTYYKCLFKSVTKYKGEEIEAEIDGVKKKYHAFIAVACNGTQFGGGLSICPVARADSGKMEVVIVGFVKGVKKMKALSLLVKGKILDFESTERFTADRLRVTTSSPAVVQLDGELYENLEFDVKVGKGLRLHRK